MVRVDEVAQGSTGTSGSSSGRFDPLQLAPVLACLIAGGALGVALFVVDARDTPASTSFIKSPEFIVWVALVAAQAALWVLSSMVFVDIWLALRRKVRVKKYWPVPVLFVLALAVPPFLPRLYSSLKFHSPLDHNTLRVIILWAFGSLVALVGGCALAAISAAARQASGSTADRLEAYVSRRDELQRVLFFLGAMIGATTLAVGAARHALIGQPAPPGQQVTANSFPPELVLAYGAYYTVFLVAAYVPVYFNVLDVGRKAVDDLLGKWPAKLRDGTEWAEWTSQREAAELFLQLRTTPVQRLQTALAILAPLAGSAVSLVLGSGTS
jgi:hypothetical protein